MTPTSILWSVTDNLVKWQEAHAGHTSKRCLEAVRHACAEAGLRLPLSNEDYKGALAITCGKTLAANPKHWGWKLVGKSAKGLPTDQPSLVFFRGCGNVGGGRIAGHVAIYKPSTNRHISNESHALTKWWAERIAFCFLPRQN